MAYVRLHDGALSHPKIIGLINFRNPFCLWIWGLSYCQLHLTDGVVPRAALPAGSKKAAAVLASHQLWEPVADGFRVHDYLQWNDSKEVVRDRQRLAKHRIAFMNDPWLKQELRARDQDRCRYCRRVVNWADRKSEIGATYDHVDPRGEATLENLVVACRGCNSSKRNRTPEQAGMTLLSAPPRPLNLGVISDKNAEDITNNAEDITNNADRNNQAVIKTKTQYQIKEQTQERARVQVIKGPGEEIAERAGRFIERYERLYVKHRHGARYVVKPHRDFEAACDLCQTWPDERLDLLAAIFLESNHTFAESGSRTVSQFRALASWCDGELAKHEQQHGAVSS